MGREDRATKASTCPGGTGTNGSEVYQPRLSHRIFGVFTQEHGREVQARLVRLLCLEPDTTGSCVRPAGNARSKGNASRGPPWEECCLDMSRNDKRSCGVNADDFRDVRIRAGAYRKALQFKLRGHWLFSDDPGADAIDRAGHDIERGPSAGWPGSLRDDGRNNVLSLEGWVARRRTGDSHPQKPGGSQVVGRLRSSLPSSFVGRRKVRFGRSSTEVTG